MSVDVGSGHPGEKGYVGVPCDKCHTIIEVFASCGTPHKVVCPFCNIHMDRTFSVEEVRSAPSVSAAANRVDAATRETAAEARAAEEFAAKVRGAVKLQAAIRRRQSRELFRSVEAHARSVRELTPTLTSTPSADIDADARR